MARRRGKRAPGKPTTMTFPHLHLAVLDAVGYDADGDLNIQPEPSFNETGEARNADETYGTHIMGRFTCDNAGCHKPGWGSKKVFIVVCQYSDDSYNAIVYSQRCKSCNELGKFAMDERSYIERVSYRLKRWAGVDVAKPPYEYKKGEPHETEYCEGCKVGKCSKGGRRASEWDLWDI
ncbi:hypothetical protein OQA88_11246 [Cercophora sp. LCS_1]